MLKQGETERKTEYFSVFLSIDVVLTQYLRRNTSVLAGFAFAWEIPPAC